MPQQKSVQCLVKFKCNVMSVLIYIHIALGWLHEYCEQFQSPTERERTSAGLDCNRILPVLLIRLIDFREQIGADASVGLILRGLCVVLFITNLHANL